MTARAFNGNLVRRQWYAMLPVRAWGKLVTTNENADPGDEASWKTWGDDLTFEQIEAKKKQFQNYP